jgi:lipoate-protein ligase A
MKGSPFISQDLGNTNFSIHLPRMSFDRHATARIVLRAVRSLGINAHINDRNDICVGKDKMSLIFLPLAVVEKLTSWLFLHFWFSV